VLRLLSDPQQSSAVYDFRHLLKTDRTVNIFLQLVDMRSREAATDWPEPDRDPPGLIPLWRIWNRAAERGELKSATVLEEVRRALDLAIPNNLTLAAEIEHYFVIASRDVRELMEPTDIETAKKYLRTSLVSNYSNKGAELAKNLRGAPPAVLLWLCWGLDAVRAHSTDGLPFENWDGFKVAVMTAASLEPDTMLPQIACLVTNEMSTARATRYEFDETRANRLFGGIAALAEIFRNHDLAKWVSAPPFLQAFLAALRGATGSSGGQ
jgi:hypothetical protein